MLQAQGDCDLCRGKIEHAHLKLIFLVLTSLQGAMEYNKQDLSYFEEKGLSVIFLLKHNILRRHMSILANLFDKEVKLLNGTHQSHVHFEVEVSDQKIIYFQLLNFKMHSKQCMVHVVLYSGIRGCNYCTVVIYVMLWYVECRFIFVKKEEKILYKQDLQPSGHFTGCRLDDFFNI